MKKYIIHYDFVNSDGRVYRNQKTPVMPDRDEANEAWIAMKKNPCFANMRPETIAAVRHVVKVEFTKGGKEYTYETTMAVEKGSYVVVETEKYDPVSNTTYKKMEITKAISDDYDEDEEEIAKRFSLDKLKKIVGVVKTK